MREERVTLSKIDAERLVKAAKDHLQELGLKIINEDVFEGYHSIKAYKGGKLALVTGRVRDVELLITGTEKNYELTLRTGAWGRDIVIPTLFGGALVRAATVAAPVTAARAGAAIAGAARTGAAIAGAAAGAAAITGAAVTAGAPIAAGAAIAAVEAYRSGKFEKNFWKWLNKEIVKLGKEATMSAPLVVGPQPAK